ncbi:hypothetical protein RJT34_12394 [Clitoria ternatea]|uniref:Uncharacterized protein n=1 Tax=Clitoria ternatea TaxID=43366 RepID=A0AAN9JPD4_CLITE
MTSESFTEDVSKEVEEAEKAIEEQLRRNPDDTDALRSLLEVKVKGHNIEGAIKKDLFHVEVYHGLVMVTSDSNEPLTKMKRVEVAVETCKKQKKDSDILSIVDSSDNQRHNDDELRQAENERDGEIPHGGRRGR